PRDRPLGRRGPGCADPPRGGGRGRAVPGGAGRRRLPACRRPAGGLGVTEPLAVLPLREQVDAVVPLPGSKSITNRALVCAALAEGTSTLRGALEADDTAAMVDGLEALGIVVRTRSDGDGPAGTLWEVVGCSGRPPAEVGRCGPARRVRRSTPCARWA